MNGFIASIYHPLHKQGIWTKDGLDKVQAFNDKLDTIIDKVPNNSEVIIGGDVKERVGRNTVKHKMEHQDNMDLVIETSKVWYYLQCIKRTIFKYWIPTLKWWLYNTRQQ